MNKFRSITALFGCSALLVAPATSFGQTEEDAEVQADTIEQVVVTGTRLIGQAATDSPLVQVTGEDFFENPSITISEFFRENVTANSVVELDVDEQNANQNATTGNRTAGVSLWNLGEENTLTLLNGSRVAAFAAPNIDGWFTTDINGIIPGIALGRADVALDGGGAIYGADAVAGVVNLVPRYGEEGFEIRVQSDFYPDAPSDFGNQSIEALYGSSFANGRGSFIVSGEYRDQSSLETDEIGTNFADEPFFQFDPDDPDALAGTDFTEFFTNTGGAFEYDTITLFGAGAMAAPAPLVDPLCGVDQAGVDFINEGVIVPDGVDDAVIAAVNAAGGMGMSALDGTCAGYDFPQLRGMGTSERYSLFTAISYEFSDTVTGFLDIAYHERTNFNNEDFNFSTGSSVPGGAIENNAILGSNDTGVDNPILEYYLTLDPADFDPANQALLAEWQNNAADIRAEGVDLGTTAGPPPGFRGTSELNNEVFNVIGTLEIDLPRSLFLRLGGSYGVNKVDQNDFDLVVGNLGGIGPDGEVITEDSEFFVEDRYSLALNGFGGPNCDPNTGVRGEGDCQYLNPFLSSLSTTDEDLQNSQELIDWIFPDDAISRDFEVELLNLNADLNFSPGIELPGGEVAAVVGLEYSLEQAEETVNDLTGLGAIGSQRFVTEGYDGDIETISAYFETALPLSDTLSVSLAGRYDDYSHVGSTFNPKVGFTWNASDRVSFRGSYGTSFRAPTVAQEEGFQTRGNLNQVTATLDGAMAMGMGQATSFIYQAAPGLEPQEAAHWSLGVDAQLIEDWGPLSNLSFNASYVNIDFDDRIVRELGQERLPFEAIGNGLCGRVIIDPDNANQLIIDQVYLTEDADLDGTPDADGADCFVVSSQAIQDNIDDVANGVADAELGVFGFNDIIGVNALFSNQLTTKLEGVQLGLRSNWDTPLGALSATVNATQTFTFRAQEAPEDPLMDFVGVNGFGGPTTASIREWRGTVPLTLRWNEGIIPFLDNHQTTLTYRFDSALVDATDGDVTTGRNNAVDLRHTFRFADDYTVGLTVRNINGYEREDPTPALGSGDRTYQVQFTYAPRQGGRGMGR